MDATNANGSPGHTMTAAFQNKLKRRFFIYGSMGSGMQEVERLRRQSRGTVIERALRTSNEFHLRISLSFIRYFLCYSPVALSIPCP